METLATVLTIPMCLGLAVAQDQTTPQSTSQSANMSNGQSFVGILVDSKCSSSGMGAGTSSHARNDSSMPRSTAADQSMMNRTTPGQSGRDWNSTDHNTAGAADRAGTGSTASASRDMNRGTPTDVDRSTAADTVRGTGNPVDRSARTSAMDRTGSESARSATDMAQTTGAADRSAASSDMNRTTGSDMKASTGSNDVKRTTDMTASTAGDMNRTTGATASGHGFDTQSASNTASDITTANAGNWDRSCFISNHTSSFALHLQDGRTLKVDDAGGSMISSKLQSTNRVADKNKILRVKVKGSVDGDTIHITDIQM